MSNRLAIVSRAIIALGAAAFLALVGTAAAHRMPEVYITLEASELEGAPITAVTVRLHAEDAIKLLASHDYPVANLDTRAEHEALAQLAKTGLTTTGSDLTFLGGEVDGNAVLLYLTAEPGLKVEESEILSSVYRQWTNRLTDKTGEAPVDAVFTQGGALNHSHRH